jgi:hypothetical protein
MKRSGFFIPIHSAQRDVRHRRKEMRTDQVFGISPELREFSYVDRGSLDTALSTMLSRSTHVAIRGPSKCGKSWLRQKVLSDPIVVQCRLLKPFTDVYVDALSQLNITVQIKESCQGVFKASLSANGEVGAALLSKVGLSASLGRDEMTGTEQRVIGHDINDLRFVAEIIKASGRRLVVEDFHYMSTQDRRSFAFDLKALWDYGVFTVIIGIWCETNLLLHLNPDLTGRVTEMAVDWSDPDLKNILAKGGEALHLDFAMPLQSRLVALSYSNAGLLQQLSLLTLDEAGITDKPFLKKTVDNLDFVDSASMAYAEQLNPLYQQFAKRVAAGIRSRKNATGIYAHAMAVIMEASDDELTKGLHARDIYERAVKRQNRVQYGNLKAILEKLHELQVDEDGRGLIIGYSSATEEITIVDRQLLLYRKYSTVKWPWEDIVAESDAQGGQVEVG